MKSVMMVYTELEYSRDIVNYQIATTPGCLDNEGALLTRNKIIYGIKTDIDVVFGKEFKKHFGAQNGSAVLGDILSLGSTATASIATNTATKTLFAALGTAFSGLSLSFQKNYYGQQAFQVLGTAMLASRTKQANIIDNNVMLTDVTKYPLEKAKADLANYYTAGTLPGALVELQQEATAAKQTQEKLATDIQAKLMPQGQENH